MRVILPHRSSRSPQTVFQGQAGLSPNRFLVEPVPQTVFLVEPAPQTVFEARARLLKLVFWVQPVSLPKLFFWVEPTVSQTVFKVRTGLPKLFSRPEPAPKTVFWVQPVSPNCFSRSSRSPQNCFLEISAQVQKIRCFSRARIAAEQTSDDPRGAQPLFPAPIPQCISGENADDPPPGIA
jgi:hypothetical protein